MVVAVSLDDKSIELLFNTQIAQLTDFITKRTGLCATLSGPPGTGKTVTLYYVAKKLGYRVWTVDPVIDQDIDKVLESLKFKPLSPTILHVLIDGLARSEIEKILKASKTSSYVVVLETTNNIETTCVEIKFYKPRARDVVKVIESIGLKPDQVKMFIDLRQLVFAKYGTLGYETDKSLTKTLEESLKTGVYSEMSDSALLLLLDSAHINFFGRDLYFFVKALQIADKCKRPHPLNGFKSVKPTIISYYLEKLKLVNEY
jgi:tRNA uridine 5-carbamoylmethylation protein Kti12